MYSLLENGPDNENKKRPDLSMCSKAKTTLCVLFM